MPQTPRAPLDEGMLARLLCEHFEMDPDQVRPDATFDELELDSLAVMELVVVIEEETGVELKEETLGLGPATTLTEAGRALARAVAEAQAAGITAQRNTI